jgi:hypothetical protein
MTCPAATGAARARAAGGAPVGLQQMLSPAARGPGAAAPAAGGAAGGGGGGASGAAGGAESKIAICAARCTVPGGAAAVLWWGKSSYRSRRVKSRADSNRSPKQMGGVVGGGKKNF